MELNFHQNPFTLAVKRKQKLHGSFFNQAVDVSLRYLIVVFSIIFYSFAKDESK